MKITINAKKLKMVFAFLKSGAKFNAYGQFVQEIFLWS